MRRSFACLWLLLLALTSACNAQGMQQAFLIQNSGWMEPFYTDANSQLKPLVAAVASAATTVEDKVSVLAFSQSSGTNASPVVLGESAGAAGVARFLASLQPAGKGQGKALADTDIQEAVLKTITTTFKAQPGIIWIFTNNKNSPNNDLRTAERNRDFYRLLHLEPSITKTLVFPLRMPVRGKLYAANGLMVYALAYGKSASLALERIMAQGRLSRVLTNAPARLKPIDENAVKILPEAVKNVTNMRAGLGNDQRTIFLDVEVANKVPEVVLQASLHNLFYPYVIDTATVDAQLVADGARSAARVTPSVVRDLASGARQPVEVRFSLPMAKIPSSWSIEAIKAMGKRQIIPMTVELSLAGQHLTLSNDFVQQLHDIFPGDPISEMFTPPDSVRASTARVPLLVRIQYPLLPVATLVLGSLLAVAGIAWLLGAARRAKRYEVIVDGTRRQVVLKPYQKLAVRDAEGALVGELTKGLGRPRIVKVEEGRSLSLL